MKIAIIGAGFSGLSAGYYLMKSGIDVTIFEASGFSGGLAGGFKDPKWSWTLEQHYHHLFTSDNFILDLANEVGHKVGFRKPISSTYIDGEVFQLDSAQSLLQFKKLNLFDRVRTGVVIAYLKITPFWKPLEKVTAFNFLVRTMGKKSWEVIWEPLFTKKFGSFANKINAAWFWARIKKRSEALGYPEGGFVLLAKSIEKKITQGGGKVVYDTPVTSVNAVSSNIEIEFEGDKRRFDKVICTLPSIPFTKITKGLPQEYVANLSRLKGLGAINLVLILNKKFLSGETYWLNVNDKKTPFLAVVEHTNFIEDSKYGGDHIVYVANYLPFGHKYFTYTEKELFMEYLPYLKKMNPQFGEDMVSKLYIFKAPFAQPVVEVNHSDLIPPLVTPIPNLYLANIQQVYPWDRGTNYAVEIGKKVARLVLESSK